jgi:hypothetical protein
LGNTELKKNEKHCEVEKEESKSKEKKVKKRETVIVEKEHRQ